MLNLKASTKDIDFTIPNESTSTLGVLFKKVSVKAAGGISFKTKDGARLDIFPRGQIFSTTLPEDFLEHSTMIKDFGSVKLYALSIYDLIITKLARNSVDDEEDIRSIFKGCKVEVGKLKKRYEEVQKLMLDEKLKYHFERLLNILLKEWEKGVSV